MHKIYFSTLLLYEPCIFSFYSGYDIEDSYTFPVKPHNTSVPPAVAAGLGNNSIADAKKETRDRSQGSVASLSYYRYTSLLFHLRCLVALFILL